MACTFGIHRTFWSATSYIRISHVWWNTNTSSDTILDCTLRVFSTWRRITRINRSYYDRNLGATYKGVTFIARFTAAERVMINNITFCVPATKFYTWINTFFSNTSFVSWAFLAHCTFRSTIWWTTDVISNTGAYWSIFFYLADGIWSTRRRYARIITCLRLVRNRWRVTT